jgi:hypothetical protein
MPLYYRCYFFPVGDTLFVVFFGRIQFYRASLKLRKLHGNSQAKISSSLFYRCYFFPVRGFLESSRVTNSRKLACRLRMLQFSEYDVSCESGYGKSGESAIVYL